jgi:hypothetical protein
MMCNYQNHDVDQDPIIVLPCGHFFATSSLDGHFGMSQVYTSKAADCIEFNGLKPLSDADINEKPRSCPDCRAIAHSIHRYGRVFRLSELRALEIKHWGVIRQELDNCLNLFEKEDTPPEKLVQQTQRLKKYILKGPTRKLYEACSKQRESIEVPQPPHDHLIQAIELLGRAHAKASEKQGDENEKKAVRAFEKAIALSDATVSIRNGARIRLHLVVVLIKWNSPGKEAKKLVLEYLDWVITHAEQFEDLLESARRMKKSILDDNKKTIAEVMMAVSKAESGGYDYGTSWSGHWYQCRNGHPYYIGECGGAMQRSHCPECGEAVGGSSHQLEATNRQVEGVFAEAMRSARR